MLTLSRSDVDLIADMCQPGVAGMMSGLGRAAAALEQKPPEDIVDWIQGNIILPPSMSPGRSGPMKLSAVQAGILRAWQEEGIERIALPKPPRLGMTTCFAAALLYMACHEGDDVLYTERTDDACKTFYKDMLLPMLQSSPNISHLKREERNGSRQDTWTDTYLLNGAKIQLRSVTGDGFARQIKARWICADEAGSKEYRAGRANSEGDKLALVAKRGQQYDDPTVGMPSTPTEAGACMVTREFLRSDQRRFDMRCPHCRQRTPFLPRVGANIEGQGLHYRLVEGTAALATYVNARGETLPDVWYECGACSKQIREEHKADMLAGGEFTAQAVPQAAGLAGFHVWAAHSQDPQSTWVHIVHQHLASLADPAQRQPFHNLVLALAWERTATRAVPLSELAERREAYETNCPQGVRWVTAGNDNQKGTEDGRKPARGELTFVGWGYGEESWILGHFIVPHEPFGDDWRDEVWRLCETKWVRPDGTHAPFFGLGVDCGHNWDAGLTFCHLDRSRRLRIRAVKGKNTRDPGPTVPRIAESANPNKTWTWMEVNKQTPTTVMHDRLRQVSAGPGSIHFPRSLDEEYLEGLTAYHEVREKATAKRYWVKDSDSEPYDCYIYAYARMKRAFQDHPKLRPTILVPPAVDVKSAGPAPTPYTGPDRSANSALGAAAAGVPATTTGVPAASTPSTPPAIESSGSEIEWAPRSAQRSAPQPGRAVKRPAVNLGRGGMGRLW